MKSWPLFLLYAIIRFILLSVVVALALTVLNLVMRPVAVFLNPAPAIQPAAIFIGTVFILNLIVIRFESDSRRIADLEEKFDELRRQLPKPSHDRDR